MKTTTILIASLLLVISVRAQKAHLGLKGGVNISSLHFDNNAPINSKVGLHAGILAHIHASKTWAIQPELLYSLEGAEQTLIGNNNKVKYNLHYLNVPVLLQYMFDNGFRLEGGPQIGFLLSAKTKTGNVTVTNTGNYQSTAFSIPLGVGYLTSSGIGLDARYVFGLSNINDDKNGAVIQSNVFQFGLFYQLSDTKKR
jgi:hypothetical protein